MLADKEELVKEKNQLLVQLSGKTEMMPFMDKAHHVPSIESVTGSSDAITMSPLLSEDLSSETSDEEENHSSRREVSNRVSSGHPPGFKDIRARVGRFSEKTGGEDFSLWLSDYKEATADFCLDDEKRAKRFSWF